MQRRSFSLLGFLVGGFEGGSGLLRSFLESSLGLHARVEVESRVVVADKLDGALLGELLDDCTGKRAVDFVLVAKFSTGDAKDFGDFLLHLSPPGLVQEDIVVKLILSLDLGPGLFLGLGGLLRRIGLLSDCALVVLTTFRVLNLYRDKNQELEVRFCDRRRDRVTRQFLVCELTIRYYIIIISCHTSHFIRPSVQPTTRAITRLY